MAKAEEVCKCCASRCCLKNKKDTDKKDGDDKKYPKGREKDTYGKGIGTGTGQKIVLKGRRRRGRGRGGRMLPEMVVSTPPQNITFAHLPVLKDLFVPKPDQLREAIAPILSDYLRPTGREMITPPTQLLADERRLLEPTVSALQSRRPSLAPSLMTASTPPTPRLGANAGFAPRELEEALERAVPPAMGTQTRGRPLSQEELSRFGTSNVVPASQVRGLGESPLPQREAPFTAEEARTLLAGGTVQKRRPKVAPSRELPTVQEGTPSPTAEEKTGEE